MAQVETERRRAPRHPADIPLRLTTSGRVFAARTVNVSQVGVLVRLPLAELGVSADSDAGVVIERVTQSLGDLVMVDFDPAQLGSLVRKGMRLVRIGLPDPTGDAVDVGCDLREALTDEELHALGLPASDPAGDAEAAPAEPLTPAPVPDIDAMLVAADGRAAPPLFGSLGYVGAGGIELVVPAHAREGRLPPRPTVRGVLDAVSRLYGGRPALVLSRGRRPVWSGAARVRSARVQRGRDRVSLTLTYAEPPAEGVWARLGIESGHAMPHEARKVSPRD